MKKLKLMLNANDTLSRDEMKKISGGYDYFPECMTNVCSQTDRECGGECVCTWIDTPLRNYFCGW